MRVNLLWPTGHDPAPAPVTHGDAAFHDLGIDSLCAAMARDDPIALAAIHAVLAAPVTDPEVIRHRHAVQADCHAHPDAVRALHRIAVEAGQVKRWKVGPAHQANGKLLLALRPLTDLVALLRRLRAACDRDGHLFDSAGFTDLVATVAAELDDRYLDTLDAQLAAMDFDHGVHLSAGLDADNRVTDLVLHDPVHRRRFGRRTGRTFRVIEEPDPEFDPLTRLRGRAIRVVADVVAEATDHVQDFFHTLRAELSFYLGCLALRERLERAGVPTCLPDPLPVGLRCTGLRDPALCLTDPGPVTGNDLVAEAVTLLVVTGANSGGKTTILRALGAAHVMMQAGMFVLAERFESAVTAGVFTHFVTGEDRTLSHGKLVDELDRMSRTVDRLRPGALLMCNESFSATGERDATSIATPLIEALLAAGVRVVFVTHLYEYARARYLADHPGDLFLRAGHRPDGTRTYRFTPGPPESTSHAVDVYRRVFGRDPHLTTP